MGHDMHLLLVVVCRMCAAWIHPSPYLLYDFGQVTSLLFLLLLHPNKMNITAGAVSCYVYVQPNATGPSSVLGPVGIAPANKNVHYPLFFVLMAFRC